MRSITTALILATMVAVPVGAQSRGSSRGVPPGQMPPSGTCRVWYNDRAPGRQPAPMSCRDAERIAANDRDARVIYGPGTAAGYPNDSRNRYPSRNDDRYGNDGRYGRTDGYGGRGGYGGRVNSAGYQSGYQDGLDKGREDARDGDSYDPVRHSRYRSADRGYDSRDGSKDQYKLVYRDGFEAGYSDGYRNSDRNRRGGSGGVRLPWPF